jgi:hypothetical protein
VLQRATVGVAAAVAAAFLAATALADGDPASDVLFQEKLFLPYSTAVSPDIAKSLRAAIPASLRVALIAAPQDLGSVPSLFGKPSTYARFLGAELQFVYTGRLLVVMPQGAALSQHGKLLLNRAVSAARPGTGGDSLAQTALTIVAKLSPAPTSTPRTAKKPPSVEHLRAAPKAAPSVHTPAAEPSLLSSGPVRPTWLPANLSTRRAAEVASILVAAFVALGLSAVWIWRRRFNRQLPPAIEMDDPYRYRGP